MSTEFFSVSWEEDEDLFINNRFQLLERIGCGNFGELRKAVDLHTSNNVAVKMERNAYAGNTLKIEYRFYKMVQDEPGFPKVYYFGVHGRYNCLVMDLLGPTLEDKFASCDRKFTVPTICRIAVQVIARLESLHRHRIIFRDVKPENFLFGQPGSVTEDVLYLIDLGLSKEFIDSKTERHIPYREGINLTGTARYMSINVHLGREQSRRDDLEAAGYMFVYLARGSLPWQGLKGPNLRTKCKLIMNKKISIPLDEICQGCPSELIDYLNYVRHLEYYDEPDYKRLKDLFIGLNKKNGADEKTPYCWKINPPKPVKLSEGISVTSSSSATDAKIKSIKSSGSIRSPDKKKSKESVGKRKMSKSSENLLKNSSDHDKTETKRAKKNKKSDIGSLKQIDLSFDITSVKSATSAETQPFSFDDKKN